MTYAQIKKISYNAYMDTYINKNRKIHHREHTERNKMIFAMYKKGYTYREIGKLAGVEYPTSTGRTDINTKTIYNVVRRYEKMEAEGLS